LIIPQLAYYDVSGVYLLGTNLWHSEKLIEMAYQYVQDAILTDGFFAGSALPAVRNFVRSFQEAYGETPEFVEAVSYDTAKILFELVGRSPLQSRSEIREGLSGVQDFLGVTGLTSFEESGEVRKTVYILQVKGDGFVELESMYGSED
jgi:ABC-type branched-subunit amino acid transport system substrate-binding protein